jgi:hypothetical protein
MNRFTNDLRSFRGGAWDLRKVERRQEQMTITFPDRRKAERRAVTPDAPDFTAAESVLWVEPADRDE